MEVTAPTQHDSRGHGLRSSTMGIVAALVLGGLLVLYVLSYPLYLRWAVGADEPTGPIPLWVFPARPLNGCESILCYRPIETVIDHSPQARSWMLWMARPFSARDAVLETHLHRQVARQPVDDD